MNITSNQHGAFAVSFKELSRWDVKYFFPKLPWRFPLVPLGTIISERTERLSLFKYPDQTFSILGVNNINGVFHAYDIKGKSIHQSYKRVYAGDIFYNPYRVNIGSIGIVPSELDRNFTSPAYVVFYVENSKIIPKFLELVFRSSWYNSTLRAATAGSVRQNLTIDLLKNIEIPLPPLQIQLEIVTEWEQSQEAIAEIQQRINKQEESIEERFFFELGFEKPKRSTPPKVFSVYWSDMGRWSVTYNQRAKKTIAISKGKYPVFPIENTLKMIQYGTSEKANTRRLGVPILRINNIKNGDIDYSDLKHIELRSKIKRSYSLSNGDVLMIRTSGSHQLVGTCAVFHGVDEYVFASYLIRMRFNFKQVNPDFIVYFLNSSLGRQQVESVSRHIMQNNINSKEIKGLLIPLPPLDIQNRLVIRVIEQRAIIDSFIDEIETKKQQVEAFFKHMILR